MEDQNTFYTQPKQPSPILFTASKFLVVALICLSVNNPICRSMPMSSENENKILEIWIRQESL